MTDQLRCGYAVSLRLTDYSASLELQLFAQYINRLQIYSLVYTCVCVCV